MIFIYLFLGIFNYVNLILIFAGHRYIPEIVDCSFRNVSTATIVFVFGAVMLLTGALQYPDFEPMGIMLLCCSATAAAVISIHWPKY